VRQKTNLLGNSIIALTRVALSLANGILVAQSGEALALVYKVYVVSGRAADSEPTLEKPEDVLH